MSYTYGLEIEAVDFRRDQVVLPEGCSWATKEVTLVNSNGLAVDSTRGSKNLLGGEINTPPTQTMAEQLKIAEKCCKVLKTAGAKVNYRCNTQTHAGGWSGGTPWSALERLKKIQDYAYKNYEKLLMLTMGPGQFTKKPEYPVAFWSHYKERMVPEWKHRFMMQAKTLEEFRKAMFFSRAGTHAPMTFMRQGINTHSFFKTKTLEVRVFWATLNPSVIKEMLHFTKVFMDDALGAQDSFEDIARYFQGKFPPELPFDLSLEQGFQNTKVDKP